MITGARIRKSFQTMILFLLKRYCVGLLCFITDKGSGKLIFLWC